MLPGIDGLHVTKALKNDPKTRDIPIIFKSQILEYLSPLDAQAMDQLCKKVGGQATTRITVILPSGKVIGDSEKDPEEMDNHVDRPEVIQALRGQVGMSRRYSRTLERDMMYVGIPLKKISVGWA
jgi:two-component system phosphate regulon sensor histidine kinase PhoR